MAHERKRNLVVRLDDDELEMIHAVAAQRDLTVAQVIREFVRNAYGALYGAAPPAKAKHGK